MGISKKKRQYIKKNYLKLSIDEIAENTGLCVRDIESVLDIHKPSGKINISGILNFVIEYGLLFCIFLSPFIIIPGLRDASNLPQNTFVQIAILVLALAWVVKGIFEKEIQFIYSPLILPLSALLVWCLISLFVAVNPFEGFPVFLKVLSMYIGFIIILNICYMRYMSNNFNSIVLVLVLAGTGIAIIGIFQYLFKFSMIPQARPPAATFANRNMAAQFMVLIFPFSIGLFLTTDKKFITWFAALSSGLMLVYVVYTRTLAAWLSIPLEISVLFFIIFYMVLKKKWSFQVKNKVFPLIVMACAFLLLINTNSGGMNFQFGGVSKQIASVEEFVAPVKSGGEKKKKTSSIEWRWAIWSNSMAMIRDHLLFGVGIGNYKIEYPLYHQAVIKDQKFGIDSQPIRSHNDYIQAAAELGVTGLIIIFSAIFCFYFILVSNIKDNIACKTTKKHMAGKIILLSGVILSSVTGILVNACFSFPFQRAIPPFVLMLMAVIASGIYAGNREIKYFKITDRHGLYTLAICLMLILGYYVHFYYSRIQFDKFYGKTIICYNEAKWHDLLYEADRAVKYSPESKDILFYMGFASYKLGDVEKSIQYYKELLKYYPHYLNALINIGISYGKLNMNGKAVKAYKALNRILPDNPGFYNDAGHYLQEEGKLEQAYKYFNKAVNLDGNNVIIQSNFGIICFMLKKYPEAVAAFKKVVKLKPGWAFPLQYLKLIKERGIIEK